MAPRNSPVYPRLKKDARDIFLAAVEAAAPEKAVRKNLRLVRRAGGGFIEAADISFDLKRFAAVSVIGAGKAACAMAKAVEDTLGGLIARGCVVTKYGHGLRLKRTKVIEAAHPVPDENGARGAKEILEIAGAAGEKDLVICLLSGGASALLPSPAGISLDDKKEMTRLLVNSGADINEINAVRKHLSNIKGGMLMKRAYPAAVLALIISDVVGNDFSTIASGPAAPDPSTFADCLGVLDRHGLKSKAPKAVLKRLEEGSAGLIEETPKPGDRTFKRCRSIIVADNGSALRAASKKAETLGYRTVLLSSGIKGSTRDAALFFASIMKEAKGTGNPAAPPACILMGGETTLKVTGRGLGGRNQEFALAAALELADTKDMLALSAGTDGTDGPTDAAGAFCDSTTARRAKKAGLDPSRSLSDNDSYNLFKPLKDLLVTGPTGTNVMDVVVGLVR